jgi:hypothetical protein
MITVELVNKEVLKKIEDKVNKKNSMIYVKNIQLAYMAKSLVIAALYQAIGDKSKHFSVQVSGSGYNQNISVRAKDNIGLFIYYGTRPHNIDASGPMPIGGGVFASSVDHPGTKSNRELIDNAVKMAQRQAKIYYRMMR